jgi:hypothetical protein
MWNPNFINHPLFNNIKIMFEQHKLAMPSQYPSLEVLNSWLKQLHPGLKNTNGKSIQFVDQGTSFENFEDGYEQRIYLKGEVQTRLNNWHDFFNAIIWLKLPEIKRVINGRHYYESLKQRQLGEAKKRNTIQNQLAHFDECGVVVISKSKELLELLRNHCWSELFWDKREEVQSDMCFEIFGHALYEKALNPYIGFTGKALLIHSSNFNNVGRKAAEHLIQNLSNVERLLSPLPILGVPGWWQENNAPEFYRNAHYFR